MSDVSLLPLNVLLFDKKVNSHLARLDKTLRDERASPTSPDRLNEASLCRLYIIHRGGEGASHESLQAACYPLLPRKHKEMEFYFIF